MTTGGMRISGDGILAVRAKMPQRMFAAFCELREAMDADSTLEFRLRELLRLQSAQLAGCRH
jgi:hypothetical protein